MPVVIETRQDGRVTEERLPLDDAGLAEAIGKLDGHRTTALSIAVSGNHLFVGGGGGKYVVSTLMADGTAFELIGDPKARGEVRLIAGGSWIDQPARYIVDAERALRACRYFAEEGRLDEREIWEQP